MPKGQFAFMSHFMANTLLFLQSNHKNNHYWLAITAFALIENEITVVSWAYFLEKVGLIWKK
jgi:hypothetical protein